MRTDQSLILEMVKLAIRAHSKQLRKYTGDTYLVHLANVAQLVEQAGGSPAQICTAWGHDLLEDTDVDIKYLGNRFGHEIADLIFQLTDQYTPEGYPKLNRSARKQLEATRLSQISKEAKMVKLADLIDNLDSIGKSDVKFARIYIPEKRVLLPLLREGSQDLYRVAVETLQRVVEEYQDALRSIRGDSS